MNSHSYGSRLIHSTAAATSANPMPAATAPLRAPRGSTYVCPLHCEIVRDTPRPCPICGMALEAEAPLRDS